MGPRIKVKVRVTSSPCVATRRESDSWKPREVIARRSSALDTCEGEGEGEGEGWSGSVYPWTPVSIDGRDEADVGVSTEDLIGARGTLYKGEG